VLRPHPDPTHPERRSRQRFPIRMDVTYELVKDRSICGKGVIVDISRLALRFTREGQQLTGPKQMPAHCRGPKQVNHPVPAFEPISSNRNLYSFNRVTLMQTLSGC
jgi:hypothetical protein